MPLCPRHNNWASQARRQLIQLVAVEADVLTGLIMTDQDLIPAGTQLAQIEYIACAWFPRLEYFFEV